MPSAPKKATSIEPPELSEAAGGAVVVQRTAGTRSAEELFWNYSSSIKIFHLGSGPRPSILAAGLVPMPPEVEIPGFLAQAARMLLGVSQAWLWEKSGVSRKTINDYENGYRLPKASLKSSIRAVLEGAGAHFIFGNDAIGVVVYAAAGAGSLADENGTRDLVGGRSH